MVNRKFNNNFVSYGFAYITDDDGPHRRQCFLCRKFACSQQLQTVTLQKHLTAMHPEESKQEKSTLITKKATFEKVNNAWKWSPNSDVMLTASYNIA